MKHKLNKQLIILLLTAGTCFGLNCGPNQQPDPTDCASLAVVCF
jgi:hypothetical protein